MRYVWQNFWTACEESWPEFFLFLGVVLCGGSGISVSLRWLFGLGLGPEVPVRCCFAHVCGGSIW